MFCLCPDKVIIFCKSEYLLCQAEMKPEYEHVMQAVSESFREQSPLL